LIPAGGHRGEVGVQGKRKFMATKVKENEEAETEREGTQDGPLLDLSDDAVKKMIKVAKKRGYVTMDELNSVLPSEEVTSEQIEDTMAMLVGHGHQCRRG
jgi:RNA polymerase primary sigma factor